MLYHIVYVSRAARELAAFEMRHMVEESSRRNWRDGITGALLYSGSHFAQWLEGDAERVRSLMDRVQIDPRHTVTRIVQEGALERRKYALWGLKVVISPSLDVEVERLLSEPVVTSVASLLAFFDSEDLADTNAPLHRGELSRRLHSLSVSVDDEGIRFRVAVEGPDGRVYRIMETSSLVEATRLHEVLRELGLARANSEQGKQTALFRMRGDERSESPTTDDGRSPSSAASPAID